MVARKFARPYRNNNRPARVEPDDFVIDYNTYNIMRRTRRRRRAKTVATVVECPTRMVVVYTNTAARGTYYKENELRSFGGGHEFLAVQTTTATTTTRTRIQYRVRNNRNDAGATTTRSAAVRDSSGDSSGNSK